MILSSLFQQIRRFRGGLQEVVGLNCKKILHLEVLTPWWAGMAFG